MLTQEECDIMNGQMYHTMVEALGIKFLPSDDDIAWAEMPINEATRQYFGILHGGASLALAETIAGAGSLHLVEGKKKICGMQVTGNHIGMSATEGKVYGKATLLHGGRTTHVWSVDIVGEDGKLISTERVTNYILSDD